MHYQKESIKLTRVDRKLWQYTGNTPKRVELAVLDYLKDKGWEGYFSEHFNFDSTLLVMMCWRDHNLLPVNRGLASISTVNCLFDKASDGYWGEHKDYSRGDLIENFETFDPDNIPEILDIWNKRKVKAMFIGKRGVECRHSSEIEPDKLLSFYYSCGGKPYFRKCIEDFFSWQRQQVSEKSREAIEYFRRKKDETKFQDKELSKGYSELFDLALESGGYLGIFKTVQPQSLSDWRSRIQTSNLSDRDILSALADAIELFHDETYQAFNPAEYYPLDLVIWNKEYIAAIEVKTPNDRLRPNQKLRLAHDSQTGRMSWIINVSPM